MSLKKSQTAWSLTTKLFLMPSFTYILCLYVAITTPEGGS